MKKIDDTKKNIQVDKMDEKSRKDLFNKFVDSGGKVIDERAKRKHLVIDREKQRQYKDKFDNHSKKRTSSSNQKNKRQAIKSYDQIKKKKNDDRFYSFFNRIKLKFILKFLKITEFNGHYFNIKFLEKINNSYKPALIEIQVMYLEIFKQDPSTGKKIIDRLDNTKPLYYEIIEMIGNVYEKATFDQIVDHYLNYSNIPKQVSELKEQLLTLYIKLHVLKPYENILVTAFEKAIDIQTKIGGKKGPSASSQKRKIKNKLFTTFYKLYPRLHWLFCHYYKNIFDQNDPAIYKILAIDEKQRPGNRMYSQSEEEAVPENQEPDIEEESSDEDKNKILENPEEKILSDSISRGLKLMYQVDLKHLRDDYDREGLFRTVSDHDKVLITYLLFKEFDKEYSFILTTNKIKFNVDFGNQGKVNFGDSLKNLYDEMRKPLEHMKVYVQALNIYEKARKEKPAGSDQYIEQTKRLESIKSKRDESSKMARMAVKAYMDRVANELKLLLTDMESNQNYINNPQDVIEFDTHIEGNKKIHGKKVYEAILTVYSYAIAFSERLHTGDLSGKAEYNDADLQRKTETEVDAATNSDKSILDQLDDLV